MPRWAGTTTERGLGYAHQRERKRLLPLAYGKPCPLCGYVMLKEHKLDLDHSVPRVFGGKGPLRMCHRRCNRSAGARLGNALRRSQALQTSRRW
jgi:5-methylcytosine-specific restriction endonuclease McrA